MAFVPFRLLTFEQANEVIALWPNWNPFELRRFKFWVKPDGHISRKKGHHTLTDEEGAKIDAMLRGQMSVRSRTATEDWKPGTTFHNAAAVKRPTGRED